MIASIKLPAYSGAVVVAAVVCFDQPTAVCAADSVVQICDDVLHRILRNVRTVRWNSPPSRKFMGPTFWKKVFSGSGHSPCIAVRRYVRQNAPKSNRIGGL